MTFSYLIIKILLQYCLDNSAKSVVLMSYFGRPDGKKNMKYTLAPIAGRKVLR
ncbi:hypothetical protein KIN20_007829 [Parelaphostrongylus tenuis]|uniref:phosphoglycerate kinase n=1 Tax=Parelaphostrongylus tenuis TaxID=148309 RepID=A0AAD5M8M5_PARTN|nr:hypothetical protein KIN20_007829 [Parelaphostrongylus tenuis]